MSFLYPGFLLAAGVVAIGVVALHFLVTREPKTRLFPTVRFVPKAQVQSTALAIKLTDILLLMLRVLAVLLVGFGLAQPHFPPPKDKVAKIAMVDVSRAVAKDNAWKDMVRQHTADAAVVVTFDGQAREVTADELDVAMAAVSTSRGSLSAGLVVSLRAASRLRERADAVDLLLISPLAVEERDAATLSVRALWSGGITVVRTTAAELPVADALNEKSRPTVEWAEAGTSRLWSEREQPDTIAGIRAGDATLIYPFERRWRLNATSDASLRIIARWIDGEPAAVEQAARTGCLRSVGFSLPKAGDAALRPDFVRFMQGLGAPCGETVNLAPLGQQFVTALEGNTGAASAAAIAPQTRRMTPLAPWLLLAALALLAIEYPLRRWSARRRGIEKPDAEPEVAIARSAA